MHKEIDENYMAGGEWQGGWIYDPYKNGNYKDDWDWIGDYVRSPINPKEYFGY